MHGGAGADRGTGRGRGRAGEGASEPWSLSAHSAGNFGVSSGGGAGRRGRPMGRGQRGRGGPGATRRDQDRDRGWAGGHQLGPPPPKTHAIPRYPLFRSSPMPVSRLPQVQDWANPVRAPLPDLSSRPIPSRGRARQQGALVEMLGRGAGEAAPTSFPAPTAGARSRRGPPPFLARRPFPLLLGSARGRGSAGVGGTP